MLERTLLAVFVAACPWVANAAALKPLSVEQFFLTPQQPSVLRWKVEPGAGPGKVEFTIRDYWGKPVTHGSARVVTERILEATVNLPQGYYDLDFPATKQRFGLVSLPAHRGEADPFFCIDSAMSWLVHGDELREGLIKVLRRSGVAISRERLNWAQINPADGRWDWESPTHYETVRRLHQKQGVEVLEMFHNTAPWAGYVGKYPQDLVGTARAWRQIGRRWRQTWGAMEVWNEPDISFGGFLPADQYLPLVKAISYAFTREQLDVPMVGGVFASYNRRFLDNAARNGLLDCVDVVSFHTYRRAPEVEALIGNYRLWLRAHGGGGYVRMPYPATAREAMPLWITESGRPWARGPDRPPIDQDTDSALDITMKAVEARACGVARYFSFVYPFYEERERNFGMMGSLATPLRSMAAYSRLASVLADKRYLGDLKCHDATVQRSRVFGDGRDTLAVLYTGRADAEAELKLDLPVLHAEGIDGRALQMAEDGTVPVPDGLVYLWLDPVKLDDRLQTDTPTMKLWTIGQQEAPRRKAPSPIVLRYQLDPGTVDADSNGYRVKAATGGKLILRVRAFNLSERPHDLMLKLSFSRAGACVIGSETLRVKAPADGFVDAAWQVDLSQALVGSGHLSVTFIATGKTADRIMPLEIDLIGQRIGVTGPIPNGQRCRGPQVSVLTAGNPGSLDDWPIPHQTTGVHDGTRPCW